MKFIVILNNKNMTSFVRFKLFQKIQDQIKKANSFNLPFLLSACLQRLPHRHRRKASRKAGNMNRMPRRRQSYIMGERSELLYV